MALHCKKHRNFMAKVLVVDDDKDILEVVHLLLTRQNYIVQITNNPEQISEVITTFKPDVILLDVNIGQHDGREICKQLKADTNIKHIPVILFSALPGLHKSYPECEASDFIAKPFDALELVEKVEKHLKVA